MLHLIRNAETVGNSWRNSDELSTICSIQLSRRRQAEIHLHLSSVFANQLKYLPKGLFRIVNDLHDPLSRRRKAAWNLSFARLPQKGPLAFNQASKMPIFKGLWKKVCVCVCFRLKLSHFLLVTKFFCWQKCKKIKSFGGSTARPSNPHADLFPRLASLYMGQKKSWPFFIYFIFFLGPATERLFLYSNILIYFFGLG